MTKKELQEFKNALKKHGADSVRSKAEARRILVRQGVITPKGNLKKPYSRRAAKAS